MGSPWFAEMDRTPAFYESIGKRTARYAICIGVSSGEIEGGWASEQALNDKTEKRK